MQRTDDRILRHVAAEVAFDERAEAGDVHAAVANGVVTLTGTAPSYAARKAATAAAYRVSGVRWVENLVTVGSAAPSDSPGDPELAESVRRVLDWSPHIDQERVAVAVRDGVVRLEGDVDAYWKRWKAEELAGDLRGVLELRNHLAVVPTGDHVDAEIAETIESALERYLTAKAGKVSVEVRNGRVVLSGALGTSRERRLAHDAAAHAPGVVEVRDEIMVV